MGKTKISTGIVIGRIVLVFFTTVLAIALGLVITLAVIIKGPSVSARNTFVTTVLESGNLKMLAHVFLSEEEIQEIVDSNALKEMKEKIDRELISTEKEVEGNFDENGVEVVKINGSSYNGVLMIVKDPSKVKLSTTYPWTEYGLTLDELVKNAGAIGGINGGIYASDLNKGGSPYGICVCDGVIQYNEPEAWNGLWLIGLDNDNILRIENMAGWSKADAEKFVKDEGIRDAVAFQDEFSDADNHFVALVINGEARELNGLGSGANPRTAIGQRADGALLLLTLSGRGAAGNLGATASDLIRIMLKYGAVNAANLDGGSSTCMYYNDEWLMNSVTLFAANKSWLLPTSFVVMGGE